MTLARQELLKLLCCKITTNGFDCDKCRQVFVFFLFTVNGPGLVSNLSSTTSVASSSSSASVVSVPAVLKTIPTVNLPITTAAATAGKPVMKVQPLSTELPSTMHYQSQQKQISLTTSQSKPTPIILATAAAAVTSTKTTTAAPQSTPAAATVSATLVQTIGKN